jgi:hypothetical protein
MSTVFENRRFSDENLLLWFIAGSGIVEQLPMFARELTCNALRRNAL